jgi:hypothetical protein
VCCSRVEHEEGECPQQTERAILAVCVFFRSTISRCIITSQACREVPQVGAELVQLILPRSKGRGRQQWQSADLTLEIIDKGCVAFVLKSFRKVRAESCVV